MEHDVIITSELEQTFAYTALLQRCITTALEAEGVAVPCEVDVLITDEEGIHEINQQQRGVDAPTDVLSFPMFDFAAGTPPTADTAELDPATGRLPLGDMVICYPRAVAQAEEFGHSVERELGYLSVHSVLHLLGYDHMDDGPQKAQMRQREEAIMNQMGITRDMAAKGTEE